MTYNELFEQVKKEKVLPLRGLGFRYKEITSTPDGSGGPRVRV